MRVFDISWDVTELWLAQAECASATDTCLMMTELTQTRHPVSQPELWMPIIANAPAAYLEHQHQVATQAETKRSSVRLAASSFNEP